MAGIVTLLLWASATIASPLLGTWQYTAYRYRGVERPATDPDLVMEYRFECDGIDTLSWRYQSTDRFCQRQARFLDVDGYLDEVVVWVNPENSSECSQDPNMQLENYSRAAFRVMDGTLEIDAPLAEEVITYIWTKN